MIGRLDEVVVDCHDTMLLARFWQGVLGGEIVRQSDEWVAVQPQVGVAVSFQQVLEDKVGKNRVHMDIAVDDLETATLQAESLGATRIGDVVVDPLGGFQVMTDPEGNEFCLIYGPTQVLDEVS
jgi:predicted enzyme related to lactoylglutathione lyase